jgi:hypothetical protein
MHRRRLLRLGAAVCVLLTLSACARAMQVGSEPTPVYRVVVTNETGETMIVGYNDGRGDSTFGAVPANSTDTFVVARPADTSITVTARNAAGTRTIGPLSVQLRAGESVPVRLR